MASRNPKADKAKLQSVGVFHTLARRGKSSAYDVEYSKMVRNHRGLHTHDKKSAVGPKHRNDRRPVESDKSRDRAEPFNPEGYKVTVCEPAPYRKVESRRSQSTPQLRAFMATFPGNKFPPKIKGEKVKLAVRIGGRDFQQVLTVKPVKRPVLVYATGAVLIPAAC